MTGARPASGGVLLIYAPVPLYRGDKGFWGEAQALNGLRLWARHFGQVIVMMPLAPGPPPPGWAAVEDQGDALERVRIEPLPMAYRPDQFLRALPATRRRIRALVSEADYLSFAIGGLFGDWGLVASWEAHAMGRPFAVWTDRVESEVTRQQARHGPWRRRIRARLTHRPMAWAERWAIRRAALGLFHGRETHDAYAKWSRDPQLVHDIHLSPEDHLSDRALEAKLAAAGSGPLRIVYAGRAEPMKGPMDWLQVLARLHRRGVAFSAAWLGEGSELETMRARVSELGLDGQVSLPGFLDDRDRIFQALREAHLFLFCHKTPESPRCLIEALVSGCPIVGYEGAYARDLISAHGGGVLVPRDDVAALASRVAALDADRARLAELIRRARKDGDPFSDEAVFRHRSEIIKSKLPPPVGR